MRFSGKTAFITGGASGIGRETALLLHQEGAQVVVFDRNTIRLECPSERFLGLTGDASDAAEVAGALQRARERFGRLDVAVNAAGITGRLAPLLDQADDAMNDLLAVNVRGVFLAMKYQALIMREAGGGSIVNIASVYARGSHAAMVLYGATKHAVVGLTEGAAVELAEHGIRVNAVAPGPIATPFIGTVTPEVFASVRRGIPQQRIGEPHEVARAIAWLSSDEASYVSGTTLNIDGGQAAKLAG